MPSARFQPMRLVTTFAGTMRDFGSIERRDATNARFFWASMGGRGGPFKLCVRRRHLEPHHSQNLSCGWRDNTRRSRWKCRHDGRHRSAARFNSPYAIAVDGSNNAYVADGGNTIERSRPAVWSTTVAGLAGMFGSDDGTGSAARFYRPLGIAGGQFWQTLRCRLRE